MSVLVFGSLNVDVVFKCDRMPLPGETVLCPSFTSGPGGKGLNQAIAARRAGSEVQIVGAVGADGYGADLKRLLDEEGIGHDQLQRLDGIATGIAHIAVDGSGENSIIVASGANGALTSWPDIRIGAKICLAQLEIACGAVADFLRAGRDAGALTILNAAPAIAGSAELFPLCDVIIVNEHELADLSRCQFDVTDTDALEQAASSIADLERQFLIVTLGGRGTQIMGPDGNTFVAARKVVPVDTTGAGDCFCGVLADGLGRGWPMAESVTRANAAAALAVQRRGAAAAMPTASEINDFISN